MSYHKDYPLFEGIRHIIAKETGFECLRADDIHTPGKIIREKVHASIESAVFVLADISDLRPNIFYEIGYAVARNKPVLLIIREGAEHPSDFHGLELVTYRADTREDWQKLERDLIPHLRAHKDSNVSLVRSMIVPPDSQPSFLVVNPKKPDKMSRFQNHPKERRTYGDYLGLIGILNAFVSFLGEDFAPEIVSAGHAAEEIADRDANLFLIGSPKVNPFTERFLHDMQRRRQPGWRLDPAPGEAGRSDYEVQLTGFLNDREFASPVGDIGPGRRLDDYGLILRGPHPKHPGRTVMIMAGCHSLGSGAACLAATKARHLKTIAECLAGKTDLTTSDRTVWVLVKATVATDGHLDDDGVSIEAAGIY